MRNTNNKCSEISKSSSSFLLFLCMGFLFHTDRYSLTIFFFLNIPELLFFNLNKLSQSPPQMNITLSIVQSTICLIFSKQLSVVYMV